VQVGYISNVCLQMLLTNTKEEWKWASVFKRNVRMGRQISLLQLKVKK